MRKDIRDKIVAQSLNEIVFARRYKQGKVKNWQKNEDLYYGRKVAVDTSRANVDLSRMQEFVHTLLSKVDNPLIFKFVKRKDAQLKRVARLNALRQFDSQRDYWDIKDIAGKKQAIIYGRAIYSYFADSYNGYKPHLDNTDVYDFLIDPSAGGLDIEKGNYMGDFSLSLDKATLKAGVKDGIYIRDEVASFLEGQGDADAATQEQTNKNNRAYGQQTTTAQKEISQSGKFRFWRWCTTYEGVRYYLVLNENGACIRIQKLSELFESNLWPYWTWAAFVDLTEFWTPSYCDYVREIFMAQAVSVNQMLDNAEQINKPMKIIDVDAIENLAELKYRKDGYIKTKGGDVGKAVQFVETQSIETPIAVFNLLETIQEKASGLTAASKGVAEEDKVGIYEGNQANTADRFGLLNKSYSFGYQRFAELYDCGVREHLSKKVAVDILGPDGIEVEEISRRDIYRKNEEFGVLIEASNAELALSESEKRTKLQFLSINAPTGLINAKKAMEMQASIVGFTEEETRQLLDVSEFGDAEMMSEAERDLESLLDGKPTKPNRLANTAYKQRFVDYMQDHEEDIDAEQALRLFAYIESLDEIILMNTVRLAKEKAAELPAEGTGGGLAETPTINYEETTI